MHYELVVKSQSIIGYHSTIMQERKVPVRLVFREQIELNAAAAVHMRLCLRYENKRAVAFSTFIAVFTTF